MPKGRRQSKGKFVRKSKPFIKIKPNRSDYHENLRKAEDQDETEDCEIITDDVDQLLATFPNAQFKRNVHAFEDEESDDSDIGSEVINDSNSVEVLTAESDNPDEEEDGAGVVESTKSSNHDECIDPFYLHLTGNLPVNVLANMQSSSKSTSTHSLQWPTLGQINVVIPSHDNTVHDQTRQLDQHDFVSPPNIPKMIDPINWDELFVKPQLVRNIEVANETETSSQLSDLQNEIFVLLNNYQDLLYTGWTFETKEQIRFAYCLHLANHVLKTRQKVINHNARINKKIKVDLPDEFRDQGLVRPKVLVLVPFRDAAYRIVNVLSSILYGNDRGKVSNYARFKEEFTGSELFMPKKNRKPEDFEQLFAGNVDDSFRIGLKFSKSLKLYADFYSSDVIIASPLGIRMLIGADGEKDRDYDFLSSIELLIMDQTDVFLMQNWDHVVHIMSHMHLQPKESHGVDFSRVRLWALNGLTRFYRQTLIFSSLLTPQLNALLSRHCTNYAGLIRVTPSVVAPAISQVIANVPHVYRRLKCASVLEESDERFIFFTEEILPQFNELNGVLIYIPSYFDFVRLRNYFKEKDLSVVQICEYTKDPKIARARDMFFHNEVRFLLYSERFHFYRRVNMKGIRHIIFYQPPTYPKFYSEMCNMIQEWNEKGGVLDGNESVTLVFSQYDIHALAGIVKNTRAVHIISSDKNTHMFTTDSK